MVQLMVVCAFGLALGGGIYFARPSVNSFGPHRQPTSEVSGKHATPFQIQISAPKGVPAKEGSELELVAEIRVQQSFTGDIDFNWILPPGVLLVAGELQDSVAGLEAGQTFQRKLVIQGFTKGDDSQIVVLQVSTEENGVRLGGAGVFKELSEPALAVGALVTGKAKIKPLPKFIQQ